MRPNSFTLDGRDPRPAADPESDYGAGGVEGGWRQRNASPATLWRMAQDRRFAEEFEAWRARRNAEPIARDAG